MTFTLWNKKAEDSQKCTNTCRKKKKASFKGFFEK